MIPEILCSIFMTTGSVTTLLAAIGILRLPDLFIRMHASTKAGTLGVGLVLLSVGVYFAHLAVITKVVAAILIVGLTLPIGSHILARAAYRYGIELWEGTLVDEIKEHADEP